MKINLTMEFDSVNEMREFLDKRVPAEYMPQIVPVAVEAPIVAEKATRKPRTPKQTEPAAPVGYAPAAPEPEAPAPVAPAPEPVTPVKSTLVAGAESIPASTPSAQPAVTAPDNAAAQAAIEAVFAAKGFQGAHQLLAQFGVQRLRELDPAKYGELIEYANDMLVK